MLVGSCSGVGCTSRQVKVWNIDLADTESKWSARSRLLATLEGHTAEVLTLACIDDSTLASAGADKTIKIWDTATNTLLRSIGDPPPPQASADEPEGEPEGEPAEAAPPAAPHHTGAINSLVLLSEGVVASASTDGSIRTWSVADGSCICTIQAHAAPVLVLLRVSDTQLVSGSTDMTARVWEVEGAGGRNAGTLKGHRSSVRQPYSPEAANAVQTLWAVRCCCLTLAQYLRQVAALALVGGDKLTTGSADMTIKVCAHVSRGHVPGSISWLHADRVWVRELVCRLNGLCAVSTQLWSVASWKALGTFGGPMQGVNFGVAALVRSPHLL